MRDEVRRKLLADYAVALVTERESWEHLRHSPLTEAQRCTMLARWKRDSARLKLLAAQLRASSPRVPCAAPDQPRRAAGGPPPGARSNPRRGAQPLQMLLLAAAMRLATEWRALKATVTAAANG